MPQAISRRELFQQVRQSNSLSTQQQKLNARDWSVTYVDVDTIYTYIHRSANGIWFHWVRSWFLFDLWLPLLLHLHINIYSRMAIYFVYGRLIHLRINVISCMKNHTIIAKFWRILTYWFLPLTAALRIPEKWHERTELNSQFINTILTFFLLSENKINTQKAHANLQMQTLHSKKVSIILNIHNNEKNYIRI